MSNELMANNGGNSFEKVIAAAVKVPGVKVNRRDSLRDIFKKESEEKIESIVKVGPVEAGCTRKELMKIAKALVDKRTLTSTGASFLAGLPGGWTIAATIPADILQFYAVALRLAQEIAYLFGEQDLWEENTLSEERVSNQLILYCGVMFGVSAAEATIRVVSSQLGKQALKQLPRQALTKTFIYPVIKSICKVLGVHMTKNVFAKGVSKIVPVVGGVVAGGMTYATMRPMGMRMVKALDEAKFDYTADEFEADWQTVNSVDAEKAEEEAQLALEAPVEEAAEAAKVDIAATLREYKSLMDEGIITEEEFTALKTALISSQSKI